MLRIFDNIEELGFITDYDIKYRTGQEVVEEES
jgi:hypothetical protein